MGQTILKTKVWKAEKRVRKRTDDVGRVLMMWDVYGRCGTCTDKTENTGLEQGTRGGAWWLEPLGPAEVGWFLADFGLFLGSFGVRFSIRKMRELKYEIS